jgi:hypothetical protein
MKLIADFPMVQIFSHRYTMDPCAPTKASGIVVTKGTVLPCLLVLRFSGAVSFHQCSVQIFHGYDRRYRNVLRASLIKKKNLLRLRILHVYVVQRTHRNRTAGRVHRRRMLWRYVVHLMTDDYKFIQNLRPCWTNLLRFGKSFLGPKSTFVCAFDFYQLSLKRLGKSKLHKIWNRLNIVTKMMD